MACQLYDQGVLHKASQLIWETNRIPCTDLDLAFAACILAKDQPRKAIRLLAAVLENNHGQAPQIMSMANALLHHGMILQSARFYGAALETNPELVNPELEHFMLWSDDEQSLWGDFKGRCSQLGELPWMTRDSKEAMSLTSRVSHHTTPIAVPKLKIGAESSLLSSASDVSGNKPLIGGEALREKLAADPGDWDSRQQLAQLLYDHGAYSEAAILIWESDPIPSVDLDLAFAARILARDQPRKAIRLLTAVLEQNRGKAVQNMGLANALLHHGMVLQSARFYGAALEADPQLVNPDLEHFILWIDDAKSLWKIFNDRRPPIGVLPWVSSDPMAGLGVTFQTTPIVLSGLKQVKGEKLNNDLYQQFAQKNAKITPPPAVTIPADRVALKYRRFDSTYGASASQEVNAPADANSQPQPVAPSLATALKPGIKTVVFPLASLKAAPVPAAEVAEDSVSPTANDSLKTEAPPAAVAPQPAPRKMLLPSGPVKLNTAESAVKAEEERIKTAEDTAAKVAEEAAARDLAE